MLKTQPKIKLFRKNVALINTITVTAHLLIITLVKQSIRISNFCYAALQKQD